MAVLFISDLHLDPSRPAAIADFIAFSRAQARNADALYILGDLFETWIGDDDDDPGLKPILDALGELSAAGIPCHFMHGNRDFLAGEGFAAATGCQLLGDFATVDLCGERILLTHGDLLCSDDLRYLELRRRIRNPAWRSEFLGKPLPERRRIAAELRALSKTEMSEKTEAIMDVNEETVRKTMRRFGVRALLHGHTHRPAIHRFELDGAPAQRIVLSDWYGPGAYLRWDAEGPRLHSLPALSG